MFFSLLAATLAIALIVSAIVARLFDQPLLSILERIVADTISQAWHRYMKFAIYVVGVSGGVRVYELEQYITSNDKGRAPTVLTAERWTLEVYRTVIETLQSIAWMLLVFFVAALIAYVVVRGFELKREKREAA